MKTHVRAFAATGILLILCGCSFTPNRHFDASSVPNAVPHPVERSPYGNPDSYVVNGKRYTVLNSSVGYDERGIASWYGPGFNGNRTSSGEIYDMYKMTAAHKTLPLPTFVRVTNLSNDRSVIVKVNDRGPFAADRIIDLSYAAAAKLHMLKQGTALVEVQAITPGAPTPPPVLDKAGATPHSTAHAKPRIYVQVGAFAQRKNAKRMAARLELHSIGPVVIQSATSGGEHWHRVRIGPLPDVAAVDLLTQQLEKIGIDNTQVIIP